MNAIRFLIALLLLLTPIVHAGAPQLPDGKNLELGGPFVGTADSFTFGIIADRAGGNPLEGWPYFDQAVREMNVLRPDFVIMPGDLIDGYCRREGPEGASKDFNEQFDEFAAHANKLEMPLYFIPGNHDVANGALTAPFLERFGRLWYSFDYRGVHFIGLCTEAQPDTENEPHHFTEAQVQWALSDIGASKKARHTVVFLHVPAWQDTNQGTLMYDQWMRIEDALKGRKYTVIAAHTHHLSMDVRNGCPYYVVATSGGSQTKPHSFYEGRMHHVGLAKVEGDRLFLSILDLDAAHTMDQVKANTQSIQNIETLQSLRRSNDEFRAEFTVAVVNPLARSILAEVSLEGLSPKGWRSSAGSGMSVALVPGDSATFRTVLTVSDPNAAYPPTLSIRAGNSDLKLLEVRRPAPLFAETDYRTVSMWYTAAPFDGGPMAYMEPLFDPRRILPGMFRDHGPDGRDWNKDDLFSGRVGWKEVTVDERGRVDFGKEYGYLISAVGYAASFVDSPDDRLVYVRFSVNDYGRVFLNGEPVGKELFCPEDGTVTFPVWLRKGLNPVMVKTANWSGNWFCSLGIGDPERSLTFK